MTFRRVAIVVGVVAMFVGPLQATRANAPTTQPPVIPGGAPGAVPEAFTPPDPPPKLSHGPFAAQAKRNLLDVWRRPSPASGIKYRVVTHNPWGERVSFLVTDVSRRDGAVWLRLMLGVEPNGSAGWVKLDDVRVRPLHDRIVVDLSRRTLRRFHDGTLRQRYRVGVGKPSTPTTRGLFFVWAKLSTDPNGPYGAYVLGLSGFSEVLKQWPGGGRMAIHGTADPGDRGHRVSSGCVRVYNRQLMRLRDVPMGTPVLIRA